ncbi:MAG: pyridine nucleotide-disulfide oxidoreductase [Acidimicrobiia bacterium]|nr:pyridine nucleotide-disulfide oxidoreductase [Acidimicrobiia bacterium]
MNLLHLSTNPRSEAAGWNFPLGIPGFRFADLNRVRRIAELDGVFRQALGASDPELSKLYEAYRSAEGKGYEVVAVSDLLIRVAPHLGRFVAQLFGIEAQHESLRQQVWEDGRLFEWKKKYLDRQVLKHPPTQEEMGPWDLSELEFDYRALVDRRVAQTSFAEDPERELAEAGLGTLEAVEAAKAAGDSQGLASAQEDLGIIHKWSAALAFHPSLRERSKHFASIGVPEAVDYQNLVRIDRFDSQLPERFRGPAETRRFRDGFKLTDERMTPRETLQEVYYCIYCHERDKDSCSKGYRKQGQIQNNPLDIRLEGCPLDEKISEAHLLKRQGEVIAALAMIMVDNPLCAGTGHRICNDCMKSCIFQKQTPVNIPQIETGILTDVLNLPYGFEIYSLLTRWNPLNMLRPVPLRYNGKNVLVVGMGPAGYALAHFLLNEGFGVVGIEGLRVEPLAMEVRGARKRVPRPIRHIKDITAELDHRTILGFGGVSEYGITVRWDKNFLDVNYLVLMRRKKFRLFDGVRFGGTLTIDDAWNLGFDHIALATGAGRPTLVPVRNNLLRGMRQASDFLMGLQASGAYKKDSLTNLQVDLPAVVIGGGLTAIDTATELMAYYVIQVEKSLDRYERLVSRIGAESIWGRFDDEEKQIFQRWLIHGRAIRAERAAAQAAGRKPDFARLVRSWGGVTIAYRKRLQDSPAYRLNHEEIIKALEEGIDIVELLSPAECIPDAWGKLQAMRFERQAWLGGKYRSTGESVELPARSVMVAAGTHPNVTYEREHPGTFVLDKDGEFFQAYRLETSDGQRRLIPAAQGETGFFTSYSRNGRYITFYGDNHPVFAGNVVKAMASAKKGYTEIGRLFRDEVASQIQEDQADREQAWVRFAERLDDLLQARVVDAFRLTSNIVEVVVRAPMAANHFRPGQFYRLQNYDSFAERPSGFHLTMEGIALTGAWVDRQRGLVSLIVLEMGGSSRLCALLNPGEPVVLMGPTGAPTEIPENETVLLAGGGLGNAVLFSIAEALKEKNNRVVYFAGYRKKSDLFKRREIEKACDVVIWSVDEGELIEPRRPQDRTFRGNIVQAMQSYASGDLGEVETPLCAVDRIISIGSDRMMNAVKVARRTLLKPHLAAGHKAIGSINSPMQCMLKEICAQCLQRHCDPITGEEKVIFSCFNQDQPLDLVDFDHLRSRLRQNSVAEKLTSLWIDHLFEQREVQEV